MSRASSPRPSPSPPRRPRSSPARPFSKAESEKLLEPWLGQGLDLSELPIPRLILLRLRASGADDLTGLRKALASAVPQAALDDHRIWAARLGAMAKAIVILAAALFALMIVAMGTAIGFATRGAMAGAREIVEVLHLVGASDAFIASEFEIHFRGLGLRGALIGGLAAVAFFATASLFSFSWAHSPGGEEIAAMFGSFALRPLGYLALVVVCAAVTLLTGLLSRRSSCAICRGCHKMAAVSPRDASAPPMLAARSLIFNALFYLNMVVLMIVGLPTMLFGRRAVFALARLWGSISVWLLEAICGLKLEYRGVENIPPRRGPDRGQASIVPRDLRAAQICA